MLRARFLEGSSSKAWVDKVPGIMLSLNAMSHEPHGFFASMVATGQEPTLHPDVQQDAHASPPVDDPSDYVEVINQRLQLSHQQMASPSPPVIANPYQEESLIFAMTTPPERANKLSPRGKGPFRVRRIPNDYQIVYEDGEVWQTIHVNHAKPAKFTAPDLPELVSAPEALALHLDIYPQVFLDLVLLLLYQPHLPGVRSPLPQQHHPLHSQPLPLRARCSRPQPRQPISGQNPLLVRGNLPDSTLSLAPCAL